MESIDPSKLPRAKQLELWKANKAAKALQQTSQIRTVGSSQSLDMNRSGELDKGRRSLQLPLTPSFNSESPSDKKRLSSSIEIQNSNPNLLSRKSSFKQLSAVESFENENSSTQYLQAKSPSSLNPRNSFSTEQRKRISISKKLSDSTVKSFNEVETTQLCENDSLFQKNLNFARLEQLERENRELQATLSVSQARVVEQETIIANFSKNQESLDLLKSRLEVCLEEIDSYRFLSGIQEQKLSQLEEQTSKAKIDQQESLANRAKKYKAEALKLRKEKQDYDAMLQQVTEQMTKLQSCAMTRIEVRVI